MEPPIPSPHGGTKVQSAPPLSHPLLLLMAIAVGLLFSISGIAQIFMWWTAPLTMREPFPRIDALLTFATGFFLTGIGIWGFVQRRYNATHR